MLPTEFKGNNFAHVILTAEADKTDADNRNGHAAFFEFKFGKKTNGATEASRERPANQFLNNLESVAVVVHGVATLLHPRTALSRHRVAPMTLRRNNL